MNTMKRLCVTLNAHINALIDQVENHEAIAEAALVEVREAMADATFQLKRLQTERKQMELRLVALKSQEDKWKEHALKSHSTDHERAIELMRRLKATQTDVATLISQLNEHCQLERSLSVDVGNIEAKFEELKRRRTLLAARESRAEAIQSLNRNISDKNVGGAFERWERAILRAEVDSDIFAKPVDRLTEEVNQEVERNELETMLSELVRVGEKDLKNQSNS